VWKSSEIWNSIVNLRHEPTGAACGKVTWFVPSANKSHSAALNESNRARLAVVTHACRKHHACYCVNNLTRIGPLLFDPRLDWLLSCECAYANPQRQANKYTGRKLDRRSYYRKNRRDDTPPQLEQSEIKDHQRIDIPIIPARGGLPNGSDIIQRPSLPRDSAIADALSFVKGSEDLI